MLLKLLTLLGVVVTLTAAVRRAQALVQGQAPRAGAADLVRCHCGAWHDPTTPCACRLPYTP
jgi:hypothetical protein